MRYSKKTGRTIVLLLFLILLLSEANQAKAGDTTEQGTIVESLSKEDIEIINNLELLELMDILEDYEIIENPDNIKVYGTEEEEEEDV